MARVGLQRHGKYKKSSYATTLSVFQIRYSFVDKQHKIIEMSVIIFTRLHVVTHQKTPVLKSFPREPQIFYGLNDNDNNFI